MAEHGVTDGQGSHADETQWTSTESSVDLGQLWQILRAHKQQLGDSGGDDANATLELVVLQVVLVSLLVVVCVCWALYCRKRSLRHNPTVVDALNKLSSPPSNGLPPAYSEPLPADSLQYLDLEAGHRRMSRLSFGSSDGVAARLGRLSVGSCDSCSGGQVGRISRQSLASRPSLSSRRDSAASRNSRVSFSDECSDQSIRRLSSNTLFALLSHYNSSSRKGSESSESESEGRKKSSLICQLQRKMGSNQVDAGAEELQKKLNVESPAQARICEVIKEEK